MDIEARHNTSDAFKEMRKLLPGFFDSVRRANRLKSQYRKEFHAVLQPEKTASGWSVNPTSLYDVLKFIYFYLPPVEWWRIYGDARMFGKRKSTVIGISPINNEVSLQGHGFQSTEEFWRLACFYYGDNRINIEGNLGYKGGKVGAWVTEMQDKGNMMYSSGDSVYTDTCVGGNVGPLTDGGFNIFMNQTKEQCKEFCPETGRRSSLNLQIDRQHPDSIFNIPTAHYGFCLLHATARIAEHLLKLIAEDINR